MKGNCSLQKDKRTEGVVISKIMLGKEKRKQKTGHSWTWKPVRPRTRRDTGTRADPLPLAHPWLQESTRSSREEREILPGTKQDNSSCICHTFFPNVCIFVFSKVRNRTRYEIKMSFRIFDVIYFSPFIFPIFLSWTVT